VKAECYLFVGYCQLKSKTAGVDYSRLYRTPLSLNLMIQFNLPLIVRDEARETQEKCGAG